LGTRASPLALAQSRLVARALVRRAPGLRIRLVPLATRGDHDTLTPLHRVTAGDFFCDRLDRALLSGEVDLCVHSRKDLPGRRPQGITLAAMPQRENPRDVVIFHPRVTARLVAGASVRIGSSSRRRSGNTGVFLKTALPALGPPARMRFIDVRGPVEERLSRLHRGAASEAALDGVVLALAGLSRLYNDRDGRQRVAQWLQGVRCMVLPLSECPAAPGQGALAIECRADDVRTRVLLEGLHHPGTAARVAREYRFSAQWPAPVRAALGVTAVTHPELGELIFSRGPAGPGEARRAASAQLQWCCPPAPRDAVPWRAGEWQDCTLRIPTGPVRISKTAVFVAHWHALDGIDDWPEATRTWVSGVKSWRRLAQRGIWVDGCADNLGFGFVRTTLELQVLGLPELQHWQVLTHEQAAGSWGGTGIASITPTYRIGIDPSATGMLAWALPAYSHFYWGSPQQYRLAEQWLPHHAQHACGPGKTAAALRRCGVRNLTVFPSRQVWQQWLA